MPSSYLELPRRSLADVRRIRAIARQMVRLDDVPIREAIETADAQIKWEAKWDADHDYNPCDYAEETPK